MSKGADMGGEYYVFTGRTAPRLYDVYAVRETDIELLPAAGRKLNSTAMTHREAVTFKSKFTPYKGRIICLVEVSG